MIYDDYDVITQAKTASLFGLVNVGFFAAAVAVTHLVLSGDVRIDAIGTMATALNIVMYASPLAAMVTNTHSLFSLNLLIMKSAVT